MIDRVIGIVGIALACITAVMQYYVPTLPPWAPEVGFGVGVFLLGISVGLLSAGGLYKKSPPRMSAMLRLHVFGDHRTPDCLQAENIFRWYYLEAGIDGLSPEGVTRLGSFVTLFIAFEEDVVISTLKVRSPDVQLPRHEVKEYNQRYAIIVFSGNIPSGTLEVSVVTR
jgi:hypothetical protein